MTLNRRLIEVAFPLKQTSIDSVHEKNVRHGHISTLHIWPARRPLAACRAALVATLLPDPEDDEERNLILEKLGGKLVQRVKRVRRSDGKVEEKIVEETEGGILHWRRESGPDLEWFRQKIRDAYGGRAPKVLDPFAGGGAIPLEAMRLGCEATAVDINPVAWFILKCTLEYPQKLAGQTRPLPDFALQDAEFMESFFKAQGLNGQALKTRLAELGHVTTEKHSQMSFLPSPDTGREDGVEGIEADLAWHVRAWGRWVLAQARRDLAHFYPTYADFEPLMEVAHKVKTRPMQLVPLDNDGTPNLDSLNAGFSEAYLRDKRNPRWVAKPTVAYLWARTVPCKNCRTAIPLLKTRWLVKKKRVVLTMEPNNNRTGVIFGISTDGPTAGRNVIERTIQDKSLGSGTISRSGAKCPCCGAIISFNDIRLEARANNLGAIMTAIVVKGQKSKEYRIPSGDELLQVEEAFKGIIDCYSDIPFGIPEEDTPGPAGSKMNSSSLRNYGLYRWKDIFTHRQLYALGTIIKIIRTLPQKISNEGYGNEWIEALIAYIALSFDRLVAFNCTSVRWKVDAEAVIDAFSRFALPILWDFAEAVPINSFAGSYQLCYERISLALDNILNSQLIESPSVLQKSATNINCNKIFDVIITDPPYYDAIPYSDLMDFFYIWLRRNLFGLSNKLDYAFNGELAPKWNHETNDGELIDNPMWFHGDKQKSKENYEEGMYKSFVSCNRALADNGRLVVVFAHKNPNAWETLVSAIIRAGFVVDGSWPIQTEMGNRTRALSSAALASSVWLVCKKRPETARPGWDNRVLDEMRQKITDQLRDFWDAGIRGPDFVWAATGPALEAYSQYPAVKKANEPGQLMTVGEFLRHVRRIVVDFVVGRVLTKEGGTESVSGLDDITTYYLLHRHDFGFEEAPAGACILYAVSCGLSDRELVDRYDLLTSSGKPLPKSGDDKTEGDGGQETEYEESSGSTLRLKGWKERKTPDLGMDPTLDKSSSRLPMFPDMENQTALSRSLPLIDQVHHLMHLWKAGDVNNVNDYLDVHGLRRNQLFQQLLQALIELAPAGSEERALLESISNHITGQGIRARTLFDS